MREVPRTLAEYAVEVICVVGMILCLYLIFTSRGSAQVVDSISVEVVGEPAALLVDGPIRAYVGDTVTFTFDVVDDAGEPTLGVVFWEVRPQERATIVEETDSTLVVVLESRGSLTLVATVERLDELAIGALYLDDYREGGEVVTPAGTFHWAGITGDILLNPGGRAALCVLGLAGDRAVFASSDACAENSGMVAPDLRYLPLRQARGGPWTVPDLTLPWETRAAIRVGSMVALKNADLPVAVRASAPQPGPTGTAWDRYVDEQMPPEVAREILDAGVR